MGAVSAPFWIPVLPWRSTLLLGRIRLCYCPISLSQNGDSGLVRCFNVQVSGAPVKGPLCNFWRLDSVSTNNKACHATCRSAQLSEALRSKAVLHVLTRTPWLSMQSKAHGDFRLYPGYVILGHRAAAWSCPTCCIVAQYPRACEKLVPTLYLETPTPLFAM